MMLGRKERPMTATQPPADQPSPEAVQALAEHEREALFRAVMHAVNCEGIDARCEESDDDVASRLMLARPGMDGVGIPQAVEQIIAARLAAEKARWQVEAKGRALLAIVDEMRDWAEALNAAPHQTMVSSRGIGRDLTAHLGRLGDAAEGWTGDPAVQALRDRAALSDPAAPEAEDRARGDERGGCNCTGGDTVGHGHDCPEWSGSGAPERYVCRHGKVRTEHWCDDHEDRIARSEADTTGGGGS